MMNSTTIKKLILLTGLTIFTTAISQSEVHAYEFIFDSDSSDVSNGVFVYDINLEIDESLTLINDLSITSLSGVTDVTVPTDPDQEGPYTVSTAGGGFDKITANLIVTNEDYDTLDNVITIESDVTTLGLIDYEATYSGPNGGSITSTTFGPSTVPVPFEFSPGLGILISTGFFGVHFLRRKFN